MSGPLYSVHNWNALFENKESRKVKFCRYVYTPNKQDGSGYGRMMAHPEGERLFGAWNAIIQVASKMPVRGVLQSVTGGGDEEGDAGIISRTNLTAEDIAYRTRFRPETMRMALAFFSSKDVGWLDCEPPNSEENKDSGDEAGNSPGIPGKFPIEGKGIEGNRIEDQDAFFQEGDPMGKKKIVVQEDLIPQVLMEDRNFMEAWTGFLEMRKEMKRPASDFAQKLLLGKLNELSASKAPLAIKILHQSIMNGWQGLFPVNESFNGTANQNGPGDHSKPYVPLL